MILAAVFTYLTLILNFSGCFTGASPPRHDEPLKVIKNCIDEARKNIGKNIERTNEKNVTEKLNESGSHETTYFPWPFWRSIKGRGRTPAWHETSEKCPAPYSDFGGGCIDILQFKVTWFEAREACEAHYGTLFTFRKKSHLKTLRSYLGYSVDNLYEDDKHFWIGGHLQSDGLLGSSKWTWIDDTDMDMKSPVWGVYMEETCIATSNCNYNFYFAWASQETRKGDCLAMDNEFDYYFSDQSCLEKRYPVCLLKED